MFAGARRLRSSTASPAARTFLTKNKKYEQAVSVLEQILPLLDLPDESLLLDLGKPPWTE